MTDLERQMLDDAENIAYSLAALHDKLVYYLRRVPGDELSEVAAVSLKEPLSAMRDNLTRVVDWIQNVRTHE
jgi:hypothetical protein